MEGGTERGIRQQVLEDISVVQQQGGGILEQQRRSVEDEEESKWRIAQELSVPVDAQEIYQQVFGTKDRAQKRYYHAIVLDFGKILHRHHIDDPDLRSRIYSILENDLKTYEKKSGLALHVREI
jgi:hypothetical protein